MFGIFMESLVIFKLYTGLKLLLVLTLLSWIYLLVREKDGKIRLLLVYAPLIIVVLFLFPLCRKYFVGAGLDGETYYRLLWTIPMGLITIYGACHLFAERRKLGILVMTVLIVLCGSLVYQSDYISKAENLYHIPDTVVEICELIAPEGEEERVSAVMPLDLIHFVRQYDARIHMPYGREMIVERWKYYNAVFEQMEAAEIVDMEALLEASRAEYCQYIVMDEEKKTNVPPEESGLELVAVIDGYRIYKDPVSVAAAKELYQYYED